MNLPKKMEVVSLALTYSIAVFVAMLGAVVFTGWVFHVNALVDFTGRITMKTNTSLAFFLSGLSLALFIVQNPSPSRRWTGRFCAMVVLLLGALSLSEHLLGWNWGIDQVFASEPPGLPGIASPNRMGPPASTCFTLTGMALLFLSLKGGRERIVPWFATAICLIALLPTIGYFYGVEQLYGLARYTGIAPVTALAFLFLGMGLLCARPRIGFMALICADDPGGAIVRRLILPALFLPLILGYVRLLGERHGVYDAAMGTALVMLILILTYLCLLWFNGTRISSSAAERQRAQEALRESEARRKVGEAVHAERQRFNEVLNKLPAYVILLSPDYRVPFANRFFEERFGKSKGKRCYEYLFNRTEPCEVCETFKVLKSNAPLRWEWTGPDGRNYDIHDFPFTDVDGSPLIMEVGMDITEVKKAQAALRQANETLEARVAERTSELRKTIEELTRFNSAAVGRELRMVELKKEINAICAQAGQPPRYAVEAEEQQP